MNAPHNSIKWINDRIASVVAYDRVRGACVREDDRQP